MYDSENTSEHASPRIMWASDVPSEGAPAQTCVLSFAGRRYGCEVYRVHQNPANVSQQAIVLFITNGEGAPFGFNCCGNEITIYTD